MQLFQLTLLSLLSIPFFHKEQRHIHSSMQTTNNALQTDLALSYLIREPQTAEKPTQAIILLHGVGSNEEDLFSLKDQFPKDYLVISARGYYTQNPGSYAWYAVDFSTGKPVINVQQETESRQLIRKFVQQVKEKYKLQEVYLGGFSQGAIMSYNVGLTEPALVEGIFALSGRILQEVRPEIAKNNNSKLPVFVAHGTQDNTLPVTYAREAKTYLETLKVPLTYHEYEMGHQLSAAVLQDLLAWLNKLQQKPVK